MGIKLGNIDAKYIKVGSDDCTIYLGDTLLYSGGTTPPTPTYQWVLYNEGDTVPSKLFYGVKLGDQGMNEAYIYFGDTYSTEIDFIFDTNYGWYAQVSSGEQIDLSEYYDETEGCYIIYFSDLGYGGMPISSPPPSTQFNFDIDLYEQI